MPVAAASRSPIGMDTFVIGALDRTACLGGFDLAAAVLGTHLQGRMEQRPQRLDVRRGARRPVQVRLAELPATPRRPPTRTWATTSSAAATATGGSGRPSETRSLGSLTVLQRPLGRQPQRQGRRRAAARDVHRRARRRRRWQRSGRRAAHPEQRRPVGGVPLPDAVHIGKRTVDLQRLCAGHVAR